MSSVASFINAARLVRLLDRDEPEHALTGYLLQIELDGPRRLLHGFVPFLHVEWCTRLDHALAVEVHLTADPDSGDLVDAVSAAIVRRIGAKSML